MVARWASVKVVRIIAASHVGNSESVSTSFGNPQTLTAPIGLTETQESFFRFPVFVLRGILAYSHRDFHHRIG